VREGTNVEKVELAREGFAVTTSGGTWVAANVVIATGDSGLPSVPDEAHEAPAGIHQIHSRDYKRPCQLPDGGVLVVGAGPSGQQIARELNEAERDVVLAAGRHNRAPRRYRGLDIWRWMSAIGNLDDTIDAEPNPRAARRSPSLPLSGARGGIDLDLGLLRHEGVDVGGRLLGFEGSDAIFAADLAFNVAEADRKMFTLLDRIDAHIAASGLDAPETSVEPIELPPGPESVDLHARGIRTVVWATGFGRDYSWLQVPGAVGADGELVQRRGITPARGLYTLGVRYQHWRSSHFIGGVGRDAAWLAELIARPVCLAA
jgi:putative flavoprotein involved in K+ transport